MYNWQHPEWPTFNFDSTELMGQVRAYEQAVAFLAGQFSALSEQEQFHIATETLVTEAIHTSRIEGENYSLVALKSSVINNLDPSVKYGGNINMPASTKYPEQQPRATCKT